MEHLPGSYAAHGRQSAAGHAAAAAAHPRDARLLFKPVAKQYHELVEAVRQGRSRRKCSSSGSHCDARLPFLVTDHEVVHLVLLRLLKQCGKGAAGRSVLSGSPCDAGLPGGAAHPGLDLRNLLAGVVQGRAGSAMDGCGVNGLEEHQRPQQQPEMATYPSCQPIISIQAEGCVMKSKSRAAG